MLYSEVTGAAERIAVIRPRLIIGSTFETASPSAINAGVFLAAEIGMVPKATSYHPRRLVSTLDD